MISWSIVDQGNQPQKTYFLIEIREYYYDKSSQESEAMLKIGLYNKSL